MDAVEYQFFTHSDYLCAVHNPVTSFGLYESNDCFNIRSDVSILHSSKHLSEDKQS